MSQQMKYNSEIFVRSDTNYLLCKDSLRHSFPAFLAHGLVTKSRYLSGLRPQILSLVGPAQAQQAAIFNFVIFTNKEDT
jgi:hypothetical protein